MKTKVNKLVKLAAAGLFLIALAINIQVTLDDPFVLLSENAIASGSDSSSNSGTDAQSGKYAKQVTSTRTVTWKWSGGVKIFVSAGTENSVTETITETWTCCDSGGNNCSSNNPDC